MSYPEPRRVCIFCPAYNCRKEVVEVLHLLPEPYRSVSPLLVVDDGSSDGTAEALLALKADGKFPNLTVISNSPNRGYGGAQKVAYKYAIERDFEAVFMLHGDGQHDPAFIHDVVSRLDDDIALSFGSRLNGDPRAGGMPIYKIVASRLLTALENACLDTHISEFHSGFRAYRVRFLKRLPIDLCSENYHFDTQILIQIAAARYKVVETPIPTIYGRGAAAGMTFPQSVRYGLGILTALAEFGAHRAGLKPSPRYGISRDS